MTPINDCNYCNDTGTVMDYVPYGDFWIKMPSACECLDRDEEECDEVHYAPLPQNRGRRLLWPPRDKRGYVA